MGFTLSGCNNIFDTIFLLGYPFRWRTPCILWLHSTHLSSIRRKRRFTTRSAGGTEARRRPVFTKATEGKKGKCGVNFAPMSTCGQNSRHGSPKEYMEREEVFIETTLFFSWNYSRTGCGDFRCGTPQLKYPQHSAFFSVFPCLQRSGW